MPENTAPDPEKDITALRDAIIAEALVHVPFDGWTKQCLKTAAQSCGYDGYMVDSAFPGGVSDAVMHFSDYADRQMLAALERMEPEEMRIRDRIRQAVLTRLEILNPHREAVRMAMRYWIVPPRQLRAKKAVWRTADKIWTWAGDTSTDYNYYTKRGLLAGVITSTTLAWLRDETPDMGDTAAFLDRRIDNVMALGRVIGKFKKAG